MGGTVDEMINNMMNADQVSYYSACMVQPQPQNQYQADQHTAAEEGGGDATRNRRHEAANNRTAAGSVAARTLRVPIVAPPSPPPRVIDQLRMRFLFQKQLQNSDVSAAGRIVIPKKVAELHLPALEAKEGTWLHLDDMDYFRIWTLKFRYWPNNSSRMYIFENTRELVSIHNLAVDDYIMIYKDDENGSYVIRAKKSNVPPVVANTRSANYNYNIMQNASSYYNVISSNPPPPPPPPYAAAPVHVINEYGNWPPYNSNGAEGWGAVRPAAINTSSNYLSVSPPNQLAGFHATAHHDVLRQYPSLAFAQQPIIDQYSTSNFADFSFFG